MRGARLFGEAAVEVARYKRESATSGLCTRALRIESFGKRHIQWCEEPRMLDIFRCDVIGHVPCNS